MNRVMRSYNPITHITISTTDQTITIMRLDDSIVTYDFPKGQRDIMYRRANRLNKMGFKGGMGNSVALGGYINLRAITLP